jgi:hypothetical protein
LRGARGVLGAGRFHHEKYGGNREMCRVSWVFTAETPRARRKALAGEVQFFVGRVEMA